MKVNNEAVIIAGTPLIPFVQDPDNRLLNEKQHCIVVSGGCHNKCQPSSPGRMSNGEQN